MGSDDFYVTVSSNASGEFFPDNTVGHFFNRLAEPLRFEKPSEWEVGLVEVTTPPNVSHMPGRANFKLDLVAELVLPKGEWSDKDVIEYEQKRMSVTLKPFTDSRDFQNQMRNALKDPGVDEAFKSIRILVPYGHQHFTILLKRRVFIYFSDYLLKVLSIEDSQLSVGKVLGHPDHRVTVRGFVDVKAGGHSLWMYSNCCEHRLVGGVRVPLLRMLVIKNEEVDSLVHRVYERPYYQRVSNNFLPSVEVYITDNTGRSVTFLRGESVATLHFRRRGQQSD